MRFHHVGCLSETLEEGIARFIAFGFEPCSPQVVISSQGVRVCLLAHPSSPTMIEIVEPLEDGTLRSLYDDGHRLYHVGMEVADFDARVSEAEEAGSFSLGIFESELFAGRRCVFLVGRDRVLVEYVEA